MTAGKFTGNWTPSIADVNVQAGAENQTTSTAVLFAIELKNQDKPDLFVSNVAANTFSNVIHLDPSLFGGGNGPQLGQYTSANEAVFALSPDGGRVGGSAPVNVLIDLQNGNETKFTGYNNGEYRSRIRQRFGGRSRRRRRRDDHRTQRAGRVLRSQHEDRHRRRRSFRAREIPVRATVAPESRSIRSTNSSSSPTRSIAAEAKAARCSSTTSKGTW